MLNGLTIAFRIGAGVALVLSLVTRVGIGFVEFTHQDVVRHKLVQRIVAAYDAYAGSEERD